MEGPSARNPAPTAEAASDRYRESLLNFKEKRQLPVVVVSGPLGSGKTTLVEKLLQRQANLRAPRNPK